VRASTFLAEVTGDVSAAPTITVPVIGGHSGVTILPILSQASPSLAANLSEEQIQALTKRIQFGGDEVVKAKDGAGSATLSMAYAGAEFASMLLKARKGEEVITQSYVSLDASDGGKAVKETIGSELEFFSVSVKLGVSLGFPFPLEPCGILMPRRLAEWNREDSPYWRAQ